MSVWIMKTPPGDYPPTDPLIPPIHPTKDPYNGPWRKPTVKASQYRPEHLEPAALIRD